jgi:hypothetical protein
VLLLFIFFTVGILIVPIVIDSNRHGRDNIFRRSGRDLLEFPAVQKTLKFIHVAKERVNATALSLGSMAVVLVVLYVGVKLLGVIHSVVRTIF